MPNEDTGEDEPRELRECVKSFLDAQRRRSEAFKNGEYSLDKDEGFTCNDCGWQGLSAPARFDAFDPEDDEDSLAECRECGSKNISNPPISVEKYQQFGYEYTEFPEDIPSGEEESYRRRTIY